MTTRGGTNGSSYIVLLTGFPLAENDLARPIEEVYGYARFRQVGNFNRLMKEALEVMAVGHHPTHGFPLLTDAVPGSRERD